MMILYVQFSTKWDQVAIRYKLYKQSQNASASFTMAALFVMSRRMRILAGLQRRRGLKVIFRFRITFFEQIEEEIFDKYRLRNQVILDLIVSLNPILKEILIEVIPYLAMCRYYAHFTS